MYKNYKYRFIKVCNVSFTYHLVFCLHA